MKYIATIFLFSLCFAAHGEEFKIKATREELKKMAELKNEQTENAEKKAIKSSDLESKKGDRK